VFSLWETRIFFCFIIINAKSNDYTQKVI